MSFCIIYEKNYLRINTPEKQQLVTIRHELMIIKLIHQRPA